MMPLQECVLPVEQRGSSSLYGTEYLRSQLPDLFSKYNINSMFDAGANDAAWQAVTFPKIIKYSAGEKNPVMVTIAKMSHPDLDIKVHDLTKDPLPKVDLLFVRDVAIHLNNQNKQDMIDKWKESSIPWILMTQLPYCKKNINFEYNLPQFPFAEINWLLAPWNWPSPVASVIDAIPDTMSEHPDNTRCMCLWHRDQICL